MKKKDLYKIIYYFIKIRETELRIAKYYSDKNFGYELYMNYWDIADSKLDVSGNFMEPRNTTSETGLRVFWHY